MKKHIPKPLPHQKMTGLSKSHKAVKAKPGPGIVPDGLVPIIGPAYNDTRFSAVGDVPAVVDAEHARPWAKAATSRA